MCEYLKGMRTVSQPINLHSSPFHRYYFDKLNKALFTSPHRVIILLWIIPYSISNGLRPLDQRLDPPPPNLLIICYCFTFCEYKRCSCQCSLSRRTAKSFVELCLSNGNTPSNANISQFENPKFITSHWIYQLMKSPLEYKSLPILWYLFLSLIPE